MIHKQAGEGISIEDMQQELKNPYDIVLIYTGASKQFHQPIIEAIQLIREYGESGQRYFAAEDEVPIEGVIQPKWKNVIVETDSKGIERVNRINYEIAVIQWLRTRLRCNEIWIEGADRYRNPDEDLPQ